MTNVFGLSTEYYLKSLESPRAYREWAGLRVYRSAERPNDVVFERTARHTLTLEMTGTSRHLTHMDGIRQERQTHPGDLCRIPADLSARFAWELDGDVQQSIVAEFDDTLFRTHAPEVVTDRFLDGTMVPADYAPAPDLSNLLSLIARELDRTTARGTLFAETVLRLLAIEIAGTAWSLPFGFAPERPRPDTRVTRAIDYIEAHFRNDISLAQLSTASGLRTSRLIQLFTATTGRSPYAYLIDRRIRCAIHLIETTAMPLAEIALEAGFGDQQHMTHAFRRRRQRSPASYRTKGIPKLNLHRPTTRGRATQPPVAAPPPADPPTPAG